MKIREVEKSDHRKLANYLVSYWKGREMHQFTVPWTLRYIKKGLTSNMSTERFIITGETGEMKGTVALLKFEEYVAEIRDEVWDSDKTGSELIRYLIKHSRKNKIRKLYSLALKNKVRFYRKHGFVKEGLLKDQFKKGENVTIMSKFL